jgi:hypothetical protein
MFYTIYFTTNMVNGTIYIGKHQTEDINDDYLGSGVLLIKAIRKYGRENFTKTTQYIFGTEGEMNDMERSLVNESVVKSDNFYNIALGGNGGCIVLHKDHPKYQQTIDKITKTKSCPEFRKRVSNTTKQLHVERRVGMYGKKQTAHQKSVVSRTMKGTPNSPEAEQKRLASLRNTLDDPDYVNPKLGGSLTADHKQKISDNHADFSGKLNPNYGVACSPEKKAIISQKALERNKIKIECEFCGRLTSKTNHTRWHGNNCKMRLT